MWEYVYLSDKLNGYELYSKKKGKCRSLLHCNDCSEILKQRVQALEHKNVINKEPTFLKEVYI